MKAVSVVSLNRSRPALPGALILCAVLMGAIGGSPAFAQFTPSDDAYTNTGSPSTNFGAKPLLDVQSASQNTYILFDLSPLPAGYTGSNISKATLKLYVNTVTSPGSFNVDFVNGTWSEKTITANLAPALGTTVAASIPLSNSHAKDYVIVDVTSAVQAWLSGTQPNDGLALVGNSPLNATFDSKESTTQSHPPELDIVFAGSSGGITGINTAAGSGLIGGGTSGTLNLSLTNTCANKQVLQWNGSAWVCANLSGSGTVTSVGLSAPSSDFTVTGSPVTTSGTLGLNWTVAPTDAATASAIVKRDGTGSFSANNVNLNGLLSITNPNGEGITAYSSSPAGGGVWAISASLTGQLYGVFGGTYSATNNTAGVFGAALNGGGGAGVTMGVEGISYSPTGVGVLGYNTQFSGVGNSYFSSHVGVWGDSNTGIGVLATADNAPAFLAVNNPSALYSPTVLIRDYSSTPTYSFFDETSSTDCRIDTMSDLACTGTVTGNAGLSRIDHPLDPANKYLIHTDVTSPDSKTVYDGVVRLDANGEALVELPDYVEALNGDFRYQLTCLGAFAPVFIADEISNHQFRIAGGKPKMKVSWQVTGIRQDAWTKTHRTVVEEEKSADKRGYYLSPDAFGQPAEKSLTALESAKQDAHIRAHSSSLQPPIP